MVENINISLNNLGTTNKNCVNISTSKGSITLYFSYKTLVGFNGVCSVNSWSNTTGKLLNEINPNKNERIPHEEVLKEAQKELKRLLYNDVE